MVVRRTIHHLRGRPHHERRAVAILTASGVVVVLFIVWSILFFHAIQAQSIQNIQAQTANLNTLVQHDGVSSTTGQQRIGASALGGSPIAQPTTYFVPADTSVSTSSQVR